jgi:hypothetical protein
MSLSMRDDTPCLICDGCGQTITDSGAWLRIRAAIQHPTTARVRLIIDCEQCVIEQHKRATLEKLHRLGLGRELQRSTSTQIAPQVARKHPPQRPR